MTEYMSRCMYLSVDEWLQVFFEAAVCGGAAFAGNKEVTIDEIKSALRKAAIREASVGVGTVERAGGETLPDAPLMFVPWKTKDGDYDLIPRAAH